LLLIIRDSFSLLYKRFLRDNVFITDQVNLYPFIISKCIEFNVELFENGKLFIHFLPVTKITSPENINLDYINRLRHDFADNFDDIKLSLIEQKKYKRIKIDIFLKDDLEKAKDFIENNEKIICTFDYHFISSYSSDIFGKIVNEAIKDIDKSIYYLQEIIEKIDFNKVFNLQDKPFVKVTSLSLGDEKNLVIGENKRVTKQSAAYYCGLFKPANYAILQPVFVEDFQDSNFEDLVYKFNKSSELFELSKPIRVHLNDELRFEDVIKRKKLINDKKYLIALFTHYPLPVDFISPLKKAGILFQIYFGGIDNFKLSNFTVKCLEKLGGHLSVIGDSQENENTYFVGIDLGHSKNENGRFSNLAVVYFDNKGIFLHSFVNKNIVRNEAISSDSISLCFTSFKKYLKNTNKPYPDKLVIHRDGKLHKKDVLSIVEEAKNQLFVNNIDVVEIIKNGFPVFACFEAGAYLNLKSGDYYMQDNYAILITNTQVDENNIVARPIIIKHKIGSTDMKKIVRQVYWFTKVYTNNLYNSTRLPATTLKANNIVSTGLKKHQATYIG